MTASGPDPAPEPNPRLAEIYAHPVGRDLIDRVLRQLGLSRRWVDNPLTGSVRLRTLTRLARGTVGDDFDAFLVEFLADHPAAPSTPPTADAPGGRPPWWRDAVFYQVYPRSFADSNGDGIGDLPGILGRLDYLAGLGVDCLWLSPVFDSPNEDMGYDVRDYRAVMAEMGTLDDLDALIAGCHARGMRIILDLVVNHTSVEHPWFQAALTDPAGPYGEYYLLRAGDPGEDGTGPPPNNWTSIFGGSAWRWFPDARRWALHLFAPGQLDLNWENPAVRREVADIVRFWRARGVDGFRLDVINFISKRTRPDGTLPDGSPAIAEAMGFAGAEHYFFGPRLHEYLRGLRADGFTRRDDDPPPASTVRGRRPDGSLGDPLPPDRVGITVGETPGVGVEMGRLLTDPARGELDLAFNFDVLDSPGHDRWDDYRYDLADLKRHLVDVLDRAGPHARIPLFYENHDNPRMVSKVLGPDDRDPAARSAVAKALAAMQLLLPGVPFLYQGQELAAVNQDFGSVADLRDVESINRFAALTAGGMPGDQALAAVLAGARDHARTPMRWAPGEHTGFTTGEPWQPGFEASAGFTVAEQQADPDSVLNFVRRLIALRRSEAALTADGVQWIAPRSRRYFGWIREQHPDRSQSDGAQRDGAQRDGAQPGADRWLVEVNLTGRTLRRPKGVPAADPVLSSVPGSASALAPYAVTVSRLRS